MLVSVRRCRCRCQCQRQRCASFVTKLRVCQSGVLNDIARQSLAVKVIRRNTSHETHHHRLIQRSNGGRSIIRWLLSSAVPRLLSLNKGTFSIFCYLPFTASSRHPRTNLAVLPFLLLCPPLSPLFFYHHLPSLFHHHHLPFSLLTSPYLPLNRHKYLF